MSFSPHNRFLRLLDGKKSVNYPQYNMRLHLPRFLSAALLAAMVSAPVYSASIPEGYYPREISVKEQLAQLNNTKPTGYILSNLTYVCDRTSSTATDPFYNGPSLFFTSAPEQSAVEMFFTGGKTKAFSDVPQLTFADINRLEFSSMSAGVIYTGGSSSSFTISGVTNGISDGWDVEFLYNSITGNCGGVIDADASSVNIENNAGVRFHENFALAEITSSGNQNQESTGGGIGVGVNQGYSITLFGYKLSFEFGFDLGFSFEQNDNPQTPEVEQMDICGGAINLVDSTLSMKGNKDVTFTVNSAVDYGGAISASPGINSVVEISNNGQVLFQDNTTAGHIKNGHVVGGGGGAIFIGKEGCFVMDSNTGDIVFKNNMAAAAGGAIYHGGKDLQNDKNNLTWTNNTGNISFADNKTGGTGGAIHMQTGGRLEMAGNTGIISFDHNKAGISGGAISALNAYVTIEHNEEVRFIDNIVFHQKIDGSDVDSFSSYYVGGAIYGTNIQIHNNESVLFQRNAEINADGTFRLRSLYVEGNSQQQEVSLSAGTGKTIEFRDSIYIAGSNLHLNSGYANLRQDGDIIFTGATTEEDLKLAKRAWLGKDAEITITETEMEDSRTSLVLGETYLNGGRLRVEHGAIFKSRNLYLNEGSNSTLRLYDAKLVNISSNGYDVSSKTLVSVGKGTTLEILGHSAIAGGKLIFNDGATWSVNLDQTHESWLTDSAALTFDGLLSINGNLTLSLNLSNSSMAHRYKLFAGTEASYKNILDQWTAGNITVVGLGDAAGATFDDLVWENNNLYYESTMVWSNGQSSGEWDFDDKNWENGKTFSHGMNVRFSNEGAGTVILTDALAPGSVKVTNDKGYDYTFTSQTNDDGSVGKLTYQVDLEKTGDGTLTIDMANDYTGTTSLEEGTLNLHDDNALGGSTLSTAEGTTLGVGDGADVVLKDKEHVIKGDVVVEEGAGLEIASGSYKASSSTVDGTLSFSWHAREAGSLSGSGMLEVTNGAFVEFQDASDFTGSVKVNGGSLFLNLVDKIVKAGEIAVHAGDLSLQASSQLTMAGGTILSMVAGEVSERVATVLADKVIEFAQNAMLSAMLSSMLDADDDAMLNEEVGGQVVGAGLILNAGSTLKLDNCHINLDSGNAESATLTLNVVPEDFEKINLILLTNELVDAESMILLFSGVDEVNFVYDKATIGNSGIYECLASHYFTGDMVGENTKLVYNAGNVYLTGLVPEPTTASLSLLALAALAARRRRASR